jgi:hypothetical protein
MAARPGWHNKVVTNIRKIPSLRSCAKKFAELQVIQRQLLSERSLNRMWGKGYVNANFCGADHGVFGQCGDVGTTVSSD